MAEEKQEGVWVNLGAIGLPNRAGEVITPECVAALQARVKERPLYGEVGHPARVPGQTVDAYRRRLMQIDLTRVAFSLEELNGDGHYLIGKLRPTGPYKVVTEQLMAVSALSIGYRAFCGPHKPGELKELQSIVCWDLIDQ